MRAINVVGLFWGRGHCMCGIDLLGGVINCVDWAAGDCRIYGRAWDLAQLVYFRRVDVDSLGRGINCVD